ncbi:RMD1 family protein [Roseomonas eburnea]|uniref:RMD1 family protein n=1 Tax=Neoroseomonas eburnea TaxID=1346889 RepID=A0A9X9XCA8_9PROT|nr:RMD1 family protein [Neoroseomonas eburnea]MBR0681344.1 RMD1 family protein [Neoroseomonas eburnea]
MSTGPRLQARALLLGERLDHRGLPREGAPLTDPVPLATPEGFTAFSFRWGAVVFIGATAQQEAAVVEMLKPRLTSALPRPMEEAARIEAGAEQDGVDPDGVIRLRDLSVSRLAVVADALAKSAALAHQEATLTEALDRLDPIVATLRTEGRLAASSRALHRQIGHALSARSRTTARVEAEDKPELLWDHPELERLHARLADEYELKERSAALDRKLSLIGDTTEGVLSLIQGRRALGLEVAVVVLVGIEVVFTLWEYVVKPLLMH